MSVLKFVPAQLAAGKDEPHNRRALIQGPLGSVQLSHTEELVDRSGLISYSGTLPAAQFLQAQPFRADSLVRRVCACALQSEVPL